MKTRIPLRLGVIRVLIHSSDALFYVLMMPSHVQWLPFILILHSSSEQRKKNPDLRLIDMVNEE